MAYQPPTLRDDLDTLRRSQRARREVPRSQKTPRERRWDRRQGGKEDLDNPPVRCECGRTVPADVMTLVPPGFVGYPEAVCDGCRERYFLTGEWTREAFVTAHGAPEEAIEKARTRDEHTHRRIQINQTRRETTQ